jgi:hypothetical protein
MIEDQDDVGAPASEPTRRPELLCADDDADLAADARNALSGITLLPFHRRCSFVGWPRRFHRVLAQFRTGGGEGARARSVSVADPEGRVPATPRIRRPGRLLNRQRGAPDRSTRCLDQSKLDLPDAA